VANTSEKAIKPAPMNLGIHQIDLSDGSSSRCPFRSADYAWREENGPSINIEEQAQMSFQTTAWGANRKPHDSYQRKKAKKKVDRLHASRFYWSGDIPDARRVPDYIAVVTPRQGSTSEVQDSKPRNRRLLRLLPGPTA
jgi:hypothetical protein